MTILNYSNREFADFLGSSTKCINEAAHNNILKTAIDGIDKCLSHTPVSHQIRIQVLHNRHQLSSHL